MERRGVAERGVLPLPEKLLEADPLERELLGVRRFSGRANEAARTSRPRPKKGKNSTGMKHRFSKIYFFFSS